MNNELHLESQLYKGNKFWFDLLPKLKKIECVQIDKYKKFVGYKKK